MRRAIRIPALEQHGQFLDVGFGETQHFQGPERVIGEQQHVDCHAGEGYDASAVLAGVIGIRGTRFRGEENFRRGIVFETQDHPGFRALENGSGSGVFDEIRAFYFLDKTQECVYGECVRYFRTAPQDQAPSASCQHEAVRAAV